MLFRLVNLFWLFFLYIIWLVFTSVLIKEQRCRFVHLKGFSSLGTVFFSVVGRNCIVDSFPIRATHPAIPGTLIHRFSSPLLYCPVQCSSCRLGTLQILSQPSRKDAHVHQTVRWYHPHPHWTPPPTCSTQHWPQIATPPHLLLPPLQVPPCTGLVSCQSPSHASTQGVRGRSAALLLDSGTHHPSPPPHTHTCLKIPVFALSILSLLHLCRFILLPVFEVFYLCSATLRVLECTSTSCCSFKFAFKKKKNFSTNQKKFVCTPKMCNLFTTANPDPQCMALENICMCPVGWRTRCQSSQTLSLDHLF